MAKEEVKNNEEKEIKKESNRHEIEFKVEGDVWKDALDKAFLKKRKNIQMNGFRKGKVPKNIYLKKYGTESLYLDAADIVLPDAYDKAIEENGLKPVVAPNLSIKEVNEESITYIASIITKPEVKIKKYKGLGIKKDEVKVDKEEIDERIEKLLEDYTEVITKDGKIENHDIAIIDYEGFKDGVAFEGGKDENYALEIGSNTFIPGFEEKLIGMKAGEEKDLELTFPEDYPQEDLAGKDVIFHVKVNEVKGKVKRELDEDFFEDLNKEDVKDEESLRKKIEEDIKEEKERVAEDKYINDLFEAVSENVEVDIPQEMIQEELEILLRKVEMNLKSQGLSMDIYYQITGTTKEDLRKQLLPEAQKNVLYRLILDELKELEKIEVSDEEVDKELEHIANDYNISKEDVLSDLGDNMNALKYELEVEKITNKLKEYNK